MMRKFLIISFSIVVFAFISLLLTTYYQLPTIHAQVPAGCATPPPSSFPRVGGLVTTPNIDSTSKFYTSPEGRCIVSSQTPFVPYKIPTYADLKSLYYDQSKSTAKKTTPITSLPASFTVDGIYVTSGDLTINSSPTGGGTQIVFVEGNLIFSDNYTYGSRSSGTVFVVKGNVNINQSVKQIDAVIISSGTICTAYNGISCPTSNVIASQLTINGSLVSLDSTKPIQFKRNLTDNTQAAEVINHQPKYLVLLRNIFSLTLQKWSEITK